MNQIKILLLTFGEAGCLTSELYDILNSSSCLELRMKSEISNFIAAGESAADGVQLVKDFNPDLCFIISAEESQERVHALLRLMKTESISAPVIVAMKNGEPGQMVELLKYGAIDFLTTPLKAVDILPRVWRLMEWAQPGAARKSPGLEALIGQSPAFLSEVNKIPLVAKYDASVLISGETGTGKELCARAIHYLSPRARLPFVPINCGAIPTELIENELFGHERGAYTGAVTSESGLIAEADNGTLFLDEVDCLPLLAQVKLLRVLQEKEYRPLGSAKSRRASPRIIAASNVDFQEAVRSGKMRLDLFYRLNVLSLSLPPLRQRREDIPLLARYFLAKYAREFRKQVTDLSAEAVQKLMCHDWPGNVRELEHVVERAVVLTERPIIQEGEVMLPESENGRARPETFKEAKTKLIQQFEKTYIQDLLLANQGNVSKAARAAQKNRRAFWQLICKYRIDVQRFRATAQ